MDFFYILSPFSNSSFYVFHWIAHYGSRRSTYRGSIPMRNRHVCLFHSVQTKSGGYSASYPIGAGRCFAKGKATGV
jgi:hypothetical protein